MSKYKLVIVILLVLKTFSANSEAQKLTWEEQDIYFNAAKNGDLTTIKKFVINLPNINFESGNGWDALAWASSKGQEKVVEFLLAKGAGKNQEYLNESIRAAAINGHNKITKTLLNQPNFKPDPNKLNKILYEATEYGHVKVIKILSKYKADIDYQNRFGMSPLMLAALRGHKEIVEYLIGKGAKIKLKNKDKETALMYAAKSGSIELFKLIYKHDAEIESKNRKDETVLFFAIRSGNPKIVDFLIAKGANIKTKSIYGDTPIMVAGGKANHHILKSLIQNGANVNVNQKNLSGDFALWGLCNYSANQKTFESAKILHQAGADLNLVGRGNNTAIIACATYGQYETVKYFIKHQANINVQNSLGTTALHGAILANKIDIVNELVKNGADTTLKNNRGQTALDFAIDKGYSDIITLLKQKSNAKSKQTKTPITLKVDGRSMTAMKASLKKIEATLDQAKLVRFQAAMITITGFTHKNTTDPKKALLEMVNSKTADQIIKTAVDLRKFQRLLE